MQQKLSSRPSGSLRAGARAGLPFSCSQCGGRERFGTLASLRTHIKYLHVPDRLLPDPNKGPWGPGSSLPGPGGPKRSDAGWGLHRRRRTQSMGGKDEQEEEDEGEADAVKKEEGLSQILFLNHLPSPAPPRPPPDLGPDRDPRPPPDLGPDRDPRPQQDLGPDREQRPPRNLGLEPGEPEWSVERGGRDGRTDYSRFPGLEAAVRGRLSVLLRAADSSMQRQLARVSWELAQTDTELLCERAHWQHLARERREAAERQRSLSRQVDVAVMVIAALKEQLNASENQLEQREREALNIQSFLEWAVRQETSGRVRVQRFIETLLERIALAERLVQFYQEEYYQGDSPPTHTHTHTQQLTEHSPHRTAKSRSAGGQPYSGLHDNRSPSSSSSSRATQDREWVWEPRQRCRSLGYEV